MIFYKTLDKNVIIRNIKKQKLMTNCRSIVYLYLEMRAPLNFAT